VYNTEPLVVSGGTYLKKFAVTGLRAEPLHVFDSPLGQVIVEGRIADGISGSVTQSVNTRLFVPGAPPEEFAPAWAIVGRVVPALVAAS
jgi:hypothetical protein